MTHHSAILNLPAQLADTPWSALLFPDDPGDWVARWQEVHAGRVRPPRGTSQTAVLVCAWLLHVSGATPDDPDALWPTQHDRGPLWSFWFETGDVATRELRHAILFATRDAPPDRKRVVVHGALNGVRWSGESDRWFQGLGEGDRLLAHELLLDGVLAEQDELGSAPMSTRLAALHPSLRLLTQWALTSPDWPDRFDLLLTLQLTLPLRGHTAPHPGSTFELLRRLPLERRRAVFEHPRAPSPAAIAPLNLTTIPTAENARLVFERLTPMSEPLSVSSSAFYLTRLLGAAAQMGEPMRQLLRDRFQGDQEVNLSQARLLRAMADPSLVEPLRWLHGHTDAKLRHEAMRGLAHLGAEEAGGPWFEAEECFWRALLRCCVEPLLYTTIDIEWLPAASLDPEHREIMTAFMRLYIARRFVSGALFQEPVRTWLTAHSDDPFAHVAWLELSLCLPNSFERNLALLQGGVQLNPDTWRSLLVHRLLHGTHHGEGDIYEAVYTQEGVPRHLHLDMLQHRLQSLRDLAARALAADLDAIPEVAELLTHRQVRVRVAAARCLQLTHSPTAVAPLQGALLAERTKSGQQALRRALEALDPARYLGDPSARYGVYTRDAPGTVNDLLEQLRGLTHGPATEAAWVRAVDVLERLRQHDALQLGADYLRDAELSRLPESVQPHHWDELPEVAAIGVRPQVDDMIWLPLAALFEESRRLGFVGWCVRQVGRVPASDTAPRPLQRVARQLQDNLDALLVGWAERGWAWCAERAMPPDALRIELFSAPVRLGEGRTMHRVGFELWKGFGVRLCVVRYGGIWHTGEGRGSLSHRVRARVEPRHPARDDPSLRRWLTQGYVDLKAALG